MIKQLFFITTLLLGGSYVSAAECIDNKSVENEFHAAIKSGGWKTYIHIEVMEDGSQSINTLMEKKIKVPPQEIDYVYVDEYLEKHGIEPFLTKLVLSSKTATITYKRQLISYNASTQVAVWNDKCLDKTIVNK